MQVTHSLDNYIVNMILIIMLQPLDCVESIIGWRVCRVGCLGVSFGLPHHHRTLQLALRGGGGGGGGESVVMVATIGRINLNQRPSGAYLCEPFSRAI